MGTAACRVGAAGMVTFACESVIMIGRRDTTAASRPASLAEDARLCAASFGHNLTYHRPCFFVVLWTMRVLCEYIYPCTANSSKENLLYVLIPALFLHRTTTAVTATADLSSEEACNDAATKWSMETIKSLGAASAKSTECV